MTEFQLWASIYFAGAMMFGFLLDDRQTRFLSSLGMLVTVFG